MALYNQNGWLARIEETEIYKLIFMLKLLTDGRHYQQFVRDVIDAFNTKADALQALTKEFSLDFKGKISRLKRTIDEINIIGEERLKKLKAQETLLLKKQQSLTVEADDLELQKLRSQNTPHKTHHLFIGLSALYILGSIGGIAFYLYTFDLAFQDLPAWIGYITAVPLVLSFSVLVAMVYEFIPPHDRPKFLKYLTLTGIAILISSNLFLSLNKGASRDELLQDSFNNIEIFEPETEPIEETGWGALPFVFITFSELVVVSCFGIAAKEEWKRLKGDVSEYDIKIKLIIKNLEEVTHALQKVQPELEHTRTVLSSLSDLPQMALTKGNQDLIYIQALLNTGFDIKERNQQLDKEESDILNQKRQTLQKAFENLGKDDDDDQPSSLFSVA